MKNLCSLWILVVVSTTFGGCSLLGPTDLETAADSTPLQLQPSKSTAEFDAIAQAQKTNSIVLQVRGAETPTRILPLPEGGQPVYLSDLLRQSGLTTEFSQMEAVLYRNSPEVMGGVRMGVKFRPGTNMVAPEHDYCLRPGDRVQVAELEVSPFGNLLEDILPSNARRAAMGF